MENIKGFLGSSSVDKMRIKYTFCSRKELMISAPSRSISSNKYENGRLVIVGGSASYHGAPTLSLKAAYNTLAALRVGAGYARAYVPEAVVDAVRKISPNTIVKPAGRKIVEFTKEMKKDIERTDVLVIGMGIGNEKRALTASRRIIRYALSRNVKVVADAEAISTIGEIHSKNLLITPHDSELSKLINAKIPEDLASRLRISVVVAKRLGINVILKGNETVITDGTRTKVNKAATPALATMGTGDVLSGIIGGYAATGAELFDAGAAGVYLHAKIGEMLYGKMGNHIIATDVIDKIPYCIKEFDK